MCWSGSLPLDCRVPNAYSKHGSRQGEFGGPSRVCRRCVCARTASDWMFQQKPRRPPDRARCLLAFRLGRPKYDSSIVHYVGRFSQAAKDDPEIMLAAVAKYPPTIKMANKEWRSQQDTPAKATTEIREPPPICWKPTRDPHKYVWCALYQDSDCNAVTTPCEFMVWTIFWDPSANFLYALQ